MDRPPPGTRQNLGYRRLIDFLRAAHDPEYLAAKAADFGAFTRLALVITAVFVACTMAWDYALDPVNAARALALRLCQSVAAVIWVLASWRNIDSLSARIATFVTPLLIEAIFIRIVTILDQGFAYGLGGFLSFFIFIPFLLFGQPLVFSVALLALITVFPLLVAPLGLSAGLHWGVYCVYELPILGLVVSFLLLFDYLYLQAFFYRLEIARQVRTDPLTGIANRRYFLTEGDRALELHHRQQHPASVLLIDIDHFKAVNDLHGHAVGDATLNHVVQTLLAMVRKSDLPARYGGEEFLVLLPETHGDQARVMAERIRIAVSSTHFKPNTDKTAAIDLTVSIGVATYRGDLTHEPDLEALIGAADRAMYEAKRRGRDQIVSAISGPAVA